MTRGCVELNHVTTTDTGEVLNPLRFSVEVRYVRRIIFLVFVTVLTRIGCRFGDSADGTVLEVIPFDGAEFVSVEHKSILFSQTFNFVKELGH